jgi:hypothetical protein
MGKGKLSEPSRKIDEADWFEQNQDQLLKLFEKARKSGSLRIGRKTVGITLSESGTPVKKPPSQKVMLRVPVDDLDRARKQAARKGIGYQTYIKMLLHDGLEREERRRA